MYLMIDLKFFFPIEMGTLLTCYRKQFWGQIGEIGLLTFIHRAGFPKRAVVSQHPYVK